MTVTSPCVRTGSAKNIRYLYMDINSTYIILEESPLRHSARVVNSVVRLMRNCLYTGGRECHILSLLPQPADSSSVDLQLVFLPPFLQPSDACKLQYNYCGGNHYKQNITAENVSRNKPRSRNVILWV